MKAFRVKQFESVHVTHESRKYKSLSWVAVPNKHDGMGYRQIVRSRDREALFAGWNLILQVVSRNISVERGWLVRDGRPLAAVELSLMTGFKPSTFEKCLSFFSSPEIGWLVEEEFSASQGESPGTPGDSPAITLLQNITEPNVTKGEKKNGASVVATKVQFAALSAQIADMEKKGAEMTPDDRRILREKRAALKELQNKQAKGDFQ